MRMGVLAMLAMAGVSVAFAAESSELQRPAMGITELDKLVGQPVDISPWAYAWRSDMAVQEKPEAYFIPRRLDRMNKVYRTACRLLMMRCGRFATFRCFRVLFLNFLCHIIVLFYC